MFVNKLVSLHSGHVTPSCDTQEYPSKEMRIGYCFLIYYLELCQTHISSTLTHLFYIGKFISAPDAIVANKT